MGITWDPLYDLSDEVFLNLQRTRWIVSITFKLTGISNAGLLTGVAITLLLWYLPNLFILQNEEILEQRQFALWCSSHMRVEWYVVMANSRECSMNGTSATVLLLSYYVSSHGNMREQPPHTHNHGKILRQKVYDRWLQHQVRRKPSCLRLSWMGFEKAFW